MSRRKIYGPFFFLERTTNGNIFFDMLQQWLMLRVQEDDGNEHIPQLDRISPHFKIVVRTFLDEDLPNTWI